MRYFKLEEFSCHCCGRSSMDILFLEMLDQARAFAGVPFKILSGYRCELHNKAVGSKSTNHTLGKASDIACSDGPTRLIIVKALIDVGFVRFGIGPAFIHVDNNDLQPSIWLYD